MIFVTMFLLETVVAYEVLEVLSDLQLQCRGIVIHPDERTREKDKITKLAEKLTHTLCLPNEFNSCVMNNSSKFKNSILISSYYGYIFPDRVLSSFKMAINLHPSYLPYNKGSYTNIWPLIDNTPAGVSIHEMIEKIDSGDILARRKVPTFSYDTGKTLYIRLEKAAVSLFKEKIDEILKSDISKRIPNQGGTYHTKKDVKIIDHINHDEKYTAKELLNILRARTFEEIGSFIILIFFNTCSFVSQPITKLVILVIRLTKSIANFAISILFSLEILLSINKYSFAFCILIDNLSGFKKNKPCRKILLAKINISLCFSSLISPELMSL